MINPIKSIFRQSHRSDTCKLNILCGATHERTETNMAKTGHNFYAIDGEHIKGWNTDFAPMPSNYTLLNSPEPPAWVEFDLVLSQNKFGQFEPLSNLARQMHLPLVSLEHTLPFIGWSEEHVEHLRNLRGDINVFISDFSIKEWGWTNQDDTVVVTHMVDTDLFKPSDHDVRNQYGLSVVNDWINRDWCCGFKIWQRVTKDMPVKVRGDTEGLSTSTKTTAELIQEYQQASIFVNTSTISPVPTVMLEAMACECAVVTTATCMIPEIIIDGHNGFISNDETELREKFQYLLDNPKVARELGQNARKTILNNFAEDRYVKQWNDIFNQVKNTVFTG